MPKILVLSRYFIENHGLIYIFDFMSLKKN